MDSIKDLQQHNYPLHYLDLLVGIRLNPERTDLSSITQEESKTICSEIINENGKLQMLINSQIFALSNENKIELLIKQYHSSLINLLDQALAIQSRASTKKGVLQLVYKALISGIDGLLSFIENRFSQYISPELRVPATYLSVSKKELGRRIERLKIKADGYASLQDIKNIIFKSLCKFANASEFYSEVTFRAALYNKELVRKLEGFNWKLDEEEGFLELNKLLIYMNFNSKSYINYLTAKFSEKFSGIDTAQQLDALLVYYKQFKQLHRKPGLVLNPNYHDLETVLANWFEHEIAYLEKKINLPFVPLPIPANEVQEQTKQPVKQKVMCVLSTDQTGLILRAADELRILVAKSMSEVFKTIVPHLSTPFKEDLSFDGMRSKSYVAEEKDKLKAIEALERVIKKIKDY